ncbi:hypothetical protein B0A48_00235 [Cryoendolithus antarcticus]|uniref:Uncharacterized protein n=1 Tax=Cryoendolithus antarcticus TaxID=1507870 RepID=A0A1V8TU64_9PEZI|nr:hypothetical protein B0A48_00235 [Cryoendolithus antarcticus]
MVATGAAARVLHQTLDPEQRLSLSIALLEQLRSVYDEVTAGLLLNLATDRPHSNVNKDLTEILASQIERGAGDNVAALIVGSEVFLDRLLSLASERLASSSDYATSTPDVLLPGYAQAIAPSFRHISTQGNADSSLNFASHWMDFFTRALPSTMIIAQYDRFITIFETLVLARYANLVAECEHDLALLASAKSILPPRWLFVLLASGLDKTMQDQNRKYIGGWMLRTDLKSVDNALGFVDLL